MSFTSQVKQEIANIELEEHCAKAQLSALLQLCSSLTISNRKVGLLSRSENPTTAKRIVFLLKKLYGVNAQLQIIKKSNLKKNNIYSLEVKERAYEILKDLGLYSQKGLLSHPKREIVQKDCCAKAYLAGSFLAYGSCNSPLNSSYHLEISFNEAEQANFVVKLLARFEIVAKIVIRRNRHVVYVKKADYVSDFLALIGAHEAMMHFEDERIGRDLRNSVSRIDNCEIANEVKTIKAASKQLSYIARIKESDKYEKLDEKLRTVADIRIKYQDYSLLELCEIYQKTYGQVISKSGMKHRLNKLESIAQSLDEK